MDLQCGPCKGAWLAGPATMLRTGQQAEADTLPRPALCWQRDSRYGAALR